jgi:hypothetical protein
MLIEVGHENSTDGLVVTSTRIIDDMDEDGYLSSYVVGTDGQEIRDHLFDNPGAVTHMPGNTALLDVIGPLRELGVRPIWVSVTAEGRLPEVADDFERCLAEYYRCDRGKPADLEDTYHTLHGGINFPPGESPEGTV